MQHFLTVWLLVINFDVVLVFCNVQHDRSDNTETRKAPPARPTYPPTSPTNHNSSARTNPFNNQSYNPQTRTSLPPPDPDEPSQSTEPEPLDSTNPFYEDEGTADEINEPEPVSEVADEPVVRLVCAIKQWPVNLELVLLSFNSVGNGCSACDSPLFSSHRLSSR